MFEKRWARIAPRSFTIDGGADGRVTIANTRPFKVKQHINIVGTGLNPITLEVKAVISSTVLFVGPIGTKITQRTNISQYTVALSSTIEAPEQTRPEIPEIEHERAVFEEEPTVAKRVIYVDEYGNPYNEVNRIPVDADVEGNTPNSQSIQRFSVADTNEFTCILPDETKYYRIKVKEGKSRLYLAFTVGETVINGLNTDIERGSIFESPMLNLPNNTTLYLRSSQPNVVVEVTSWQKSI